MLNFEVEEAGVLGQGALIGLVEDVVLVTLGGPVIPWPSRLPVVDRLQVPPPALQAGAGVGGPRPGVWGPPGPTRRLAIAQVAVCPSAAGQVKIDERAAPDAFPLS